MQLFPARLKVLFQSNTFFFDSPEQAWEWAPESAGDQRKELKPWVEPSLQAHQQRKCSRSRKSRVVAGELKGHPEASPVELRRELELRRAEFRQVSLGETQQHWQASTQRVYELGDKTGKLLYWLATRDVSVRVVPLIRDGTGAGKEDLLAIAGTFASYHENFYARVPQPMVEQENPILGDILLSSLPSSLAAEFDLPLSEEEVGEAISAL
ncbi:hypothetical protein NDU88_000519 [Pleurodeles waltl]|uniref:Uncharacterized protein n=1 Tax=Pleurodeles waltl TaxID=8319 RepID=A0AAV7Q1H8_PLEWA|nr:hypothetical protein NDU88_000519 [Pleurodeles waltl]